MLMLSIEELLALNHIITKRESNFPSSVLAHWETGTEPAKVKNDVQDLLMNAQGWGNVSACLIVQGPRIGFGLGWRVENSVSMYAEMS